MELAAERRRNFRLPKSVVFCLDFLLLIWLLLNRHAVVLGDQLENFDLQSRIGGAAAALEIELITVQRADHFAGFQPTVTQLPALVRTIVLYAKNLAIAF